MLILSGYGEEQYSTNLVKQETVISIPEEQTKKITIEPVAKTETKQIQPEIIKAKETEATKPKDKEVQIVVKKKNNWIPFVAIGAFALYLAYQGKQ